MAAFCHYDLQVSLRFASQLEICKPVSQFASHFRLSRREVSSKRRADATIEYANRVTVIRRQYWSTPGLAPRRKSRCTPILPSDYGDTVRVFNCCIGAPF